LQVGAAFFFELQLLAVIEEQPQMATFKRELFWYHPWHVDTIYRSFSTL